MTQYGPVISNNIFYTGNHNTIHFIEFATFVRGNIHGNIFEVDSGAPTGCCAIKGTGTAHSTPIVGNTFMNSGSLTGTCIDISEFDYSVIVGNTFRYWTIPITLGTAVGTIIRSNYGYMTENRGTSTGTGAQQTIAHGLNVIPNNVQITPTATAATEASMTAASDATNIYITVTNAKTYQWYAGSI